MISTCWQFLTLAPIALVVELDVEEVDGAVESFQARQLLGDVTPEVVGNFDVATRDHHLGVGAGVEDSAVLLGSITIVLSDSTE